jgi:hypothetical protein
MITCEEALERNKVNVTNLGSRFSPDCRNRKRTFYYSKFSWIKCAQARKSTVSIHPMVSAPLNLHGMVDLQFACIASVEWRFGSRGGGCRLMFDDCNLVLRCRRRCNKAAVAAALFWRRWEQQEND